VGYIVTYGKSAPLTALIVVCAEPSRRPLGSRIAAPPLAVVRWAFGRKLGGGDRQLVLVSAAYWPRATDRVGCRPSILVVIGWREIVASGSRSGFRTALAG